VTIGCASFLVIYCAMDYCMEIGQVIWLQDYDVCNFARSLVGCSFSAKEVEVVCLGNGLASGLGVETRLAQLL
jgi:hypothetical protein